MCYWKQWRWARTKIKHLLALGVSLKSAIQHGVSSNSYWQMSRTPVIQQAVPNAWLKEQGLLTFGARPRATRQREKGKLRRACRLVDFLQPQEIALDARLCQSDDIRATLDSGPAARQEVRIMGGLRSTENRGKITGPAGCNCPAQAPDPLGILFSGTDSVS